jgi:purine nucleosidase
MDKLLQHDDAWYSSRLAPPTGRPRIVIDTDTANEIDDQFALAWALLSAQQLDVLAVYAEPFSFAHRRSDYPHAPADSPFFNSPADGVARSYDEILTVFDKLGLPPAGRVFRGSGRYMRETSDPVASESADHLVATAQGHTRSDPLYVVALGCVTNIASALVIAPDIAEKIVVVWTSGFPSHAPHVNESFNLEQDLIASQILMDSGVPLIYLPGFHVGAQLRLSLPEMELYVKGRGAIGDYLHQLYTHNPLWPMLGIDSFYAHSWVIWDVICIAWLIDPQWVPSELVRTPRLGDDRRWYAESGRPLMREAYAVQRDAVFGDFFRKLEAASRLAAPG